MDFSERYESMMKAMRVYIYTRQREREKLGDDFSWALASQQYGQGVYEYGRGALELTLLTPLPFTWPWLPGDRAARLPGTQLSPCVYLASLTKSAESLAPISASDHPPGLHALRFRLCRQFQCKTLPGIYGHV